MRLTAGPALLISIGLFTTSLVAADSLREEGVAEGSDPRWIVGLDGGLAALAAGDEFGGATILRADSSANVLVLDGKPRPDNEEGSRVRFVEKDSLVRAAWVPDDEYLDLQYSIFNSGLIGAWDRTRGSTSVKLCMVDTGLWRGHEDIARYVNGYDFVWYDTDPNDANGHGTFTTSIAAGATDNGVGVAGVAQVSILVARVLDADGWGFTSDVAMGIRWCADQGASVISLALGGPSSVTMMRDAVKYATKKGALLVAAAGNGACSNCVDYPAAYPEVLAVSCVDEDSDLCWYSSTGPEVDLAAPGDELLGAFPSFSDSYEYGSGTSGSAAFVAGVAALVKASTPSAKAADLRARLLTTAVDLGSAGADPLFGFGAVNAYLAVVNPGMLSLNVANPVGEAPVIDVLIAQGSAPVASCLYHRVDVYVECDDVETAGTKIPLAAGKYAVTLSAPGMSDLKSTVTITGGKSTTLKATLVSVLATVTLKLPAGTGAFEIEFESADNYGYCAGDAVEQRLECEDDAVSAAWPSLRLPAGTYEVLAVSADEEAEVFSKEGLALKPSAKATLDVVFPLNYVPFTPVIGNADLVAYVFGVFDGDDLVEACYVDRVDWSGSVCDNGLFKPTAVAGTFNAPGSGAASWNMLFLPAGDQEEGAPGVAVKAQKFTLGKPLTPSVKFKPNTLKVTVKGGRAATADIVVVDSFGREFLAEDRSSATFAWLSAGAVEELWAEDDDGKFAEGNVVVKAGGSVSATLKLR